MKAEGFLLGQWVLLHQNTKEINGNTDVEVLSGHRRTTAAKFADLLTIPAVMISGLTEEQKKTIIVQPPPVEIAKIGEFKAVQILVGQMGQKKIGQRIGIEQNAVQEYCALNALPKALQDRWYAYVRNPSKAPFPLGRKAILALYGAKLRDDKGETLDAEGKAYKVREPNLSAEGGVEYHTLLNSYINGGIKEAPRVSAKTLNDIAAGIKDDTVLDMVHGLAGKEGVDSQKAIKKALDLTGRMTNLLRLKVKNSILATFLTFPESTDPVEDRKRQQVLADLISDALDAFVGPNNDPRTAWAVADVNKPDVVDSSEPVSGYEGALPPIEVAVNPNPEMMKITSEAGVTTEVRADSSTLVSEPESEAVQPEPVSELVPSNSGSKKTAKSRK
jgi:hypothetical protein